MLLFIECSSSPKTVLIFTYQPIYFATKFKVVRISKFCGQNRDKVFESDKCCHICTMRLKRFLVEYLSGI